MTYAETTLPEFDQEMAKTRKVLERIPQDKLDWRPHPRSNTIGWNSNHLADLPHWLFVTITEPSLEIAPVGGEPYQLPKLKNALQILDLFDKNVVAARQVLAAVKDEDMAKMWSLLMAGKPIFTMPRAAVVRNMVLNHLIHHRAVLCVYLRMNDIPVPGMYGPSGDD